MIELIETTMVYKFPKLSRQEIAHMLGLVELKETRVYQEGQVNEAKALVLKQLTRKVGAVIPEVRAQVDALSLERLEALGEALLDFSSIDDLALWLEES